MERDVLFSKVADWRVPAGSMSTSTANYPLLIFTCFSGEAGRDRVIRIRVACSLPDKSHLDTCPAEGRKSV